jgi:energy-converting hydrogenase A subunit M
VKHKEDGCEVPFCDTCLARIKDIGRLADKLHSKATQTNPNIQTLIEQRTLWLGWLKSFLDTGRLDEVAECNRQIDDIIKVFSGGSDASSTHTKDN